MNTLIYRKESRGLEKQSELDQAMLLSLPHFPVYLAMTNDGCQMITENDPLKMSAVPVTECKLL